MATDDECRRVAHEYARLAGLTMRRNVRGQLTDLARGRTALAQHECRSDACVSPFYAASHQFTRNATIKTTIEAVKM